MAVAGLVLGLVSTPAAGIGAAFEVEGEVTKHLHETPPVRDYEGNEADEASEGATTFQYRFSVTVQGERYFIRLEPLFEQTAPEPRYVELGFDGEQQYAYLRSGRHSSLSTGGVENIADQGFLSRQTIPVALADAVMPPLWLAFASGDYLRRSSPERLPPLWVEPVSISLLDQVAYPCQFEWLAGAGSPPRSMLVRTEGIHYVSDTVNGFQRLRLSPPHDRGYVRAEYTVRETLSLNGVQVPRSATFRLYGLAPLNQELKHRLIYEIDIRATNLLETVRRRTFLPTIVTKTTIVDGRREGNPVEANYAATHWPRYDDPLVRYAFRKADREHRSTLDFWAQHRSRRLSSLLFFVAVTGTLVALVIQWLRRRPKLP